MALDGAFLYRICRELSETAIGAGEKNPRENPQNPRENPQNPRENPQNPRENPQNPRIEKIHQPAREEIVLSLRWRGGSGKLLLSASADSPRMHFTTADIENPKSPPMFCMLLRKHLGSGKLLRIRQEGLDRVAHLDFETLNEFAEPTTVTVTMEIMGRHSNIILIGADGKIIDAIKRVTAETSSVRQVLPGMAYRLPPSQQKLSVMTDGVDAVIGRLRELSPETELSKGLMTVAEGFSPLVCREAAHYTARGGELALGDLDREAEDRLKFKLGQIAAAIGGDGAQPTILCNAEGIPKEFSFIGIRQYGGLFTERQYDSCNEVLNRFYRDRGAAERMRQRSHDLLRFLANTAERLARKVENQKLELAQSRDREQLKCTGDIISANFHLLQKGQIFAELENFYEEGSPPVRIALDPALTPQQNAQKYYSEYRKAGTAEKKLTELIARGEQEAEYIDTVFDLLVRARTEGELAAIREELASQGFLRRRGGKDTKKGKSAKPEKLAPLRFRSSDGFAILAGRSNLQNDALTLKDGRTGDIWLHTQKIPGSHVLVISEGREIPDRTLEEAAVIAAYHSKARESAQVPVDYTDVRNVKKPSGAKPGMVIYEQYQTAVVTPDEDRVAGLAEGS